MDKKFKILLICGASAFLAGPLLYLFLEGTDAVKAIVAALVISLIAAAGIFSAATFLRAKDKKVRIASYTAIVIAAVFALFCLTIISLAPRVLFYPGFEEESYNRLLTMEDSGRPKPEWVETESGIRGWKLPAKGIPDHTMRPAVLFFGGNGMESSTFIENYVIKDDATYGGLTEKCDLIFLDYPQYGKSEGDLDVKGLKKMALDAFDYVSSCVEYDRIIVMGYSLGTGLATYVASERADTVDGLILMAPYENSYDLYNNVINIFHGPLKLLVTYNLDSGSFAKKVTCPTLIFASPEDEVIPYESSRRLFADFTKSSVNFVTAGGNKHNDFMKDANVFSQAGKFAWEVKR